ncbi:hypothetical protein MGU_05314 [Metarhizium guizhouense ARSEF 977]|uniref:Uncharacterized protein n=1 Tax=Metarhizium guizhouense (strain ARSEF 977) TaxID=1276136 RepID=A0A0B4GKN2_METGA|nr:hypothetical protein MGU_05314 [Metarhizium guizhouense ARSEF 977]
MSIYNTVNQGKPIEGMGHPSHVSSGPRSTSDAAPAYGIDIFSAADQTGNAPGATYKNPAAMGVIVDFVAA